MSNTMIGYNPCQCAHRLDDHATTGRWACGRCDCVEFVAPTTDCPHGVPSLTLLPHTWSEVLVTEYVASADCAVCVADPRPRHALEVEL